MGNDTIFFQPTFGNRPESIVGRDGEIASFIQGLKEPVGSRDRCTLFLGQRGMGKTALLLELEGRAEENGFLAVRSTAHEGLQDEIIEQIQLKGSKLFKDEKRHISGISAGVLGFSIGLTFSEEARKQFGFRAKLSMLCDKLAEKGKGILILIDEVHTSVEMREVAATFQELVGDGKNIAMAMAGLPSSVSGVLNDKVLTFLNRARKVELGLISISSIKAYYEYAFTKSGIKYEPSILDKAASETSGMPYLMQLMGYYLVQFSRKNMTIDSEVFENAKKSAMKDMEDNVFYPILSPISEKDLFYLRAIADFGEKADVSELLKRLGKDGNSFQVYRKRLIEAGILGSSKRGELEFCVPFLSEYIRKESEQSVL